MSQAKARLCDFDQIFELQSLSKTVFTVSQVSKLQDQLLHNKKGDGTLPQAIPGGSRPTGVGGARNIFKEVTSSFFVTVGFVHDVDPL